MSFAVFLTVCLIIYNGVPVTGQQECTDRFMELDLIKYRAIQTANGLNTRLNDEIRVLTEYQFNCSSTNITSVILGIDIRLPTGSRTLFPSIQLYRPGAGNVEIGETNYALIDEKVIHYSTSNVSTSGVYEYQLDPPITPNSNDLLAVYQPREMDSIVRVYYIDEMNFTSIRLSLTTSRNDQLVLVYPVTDGNCVSSFNSITDSTIRQNALKVYGTGNINERRQYIYPEMKFSCNGTTCITKWIYGGTENDGSRLPELQIWRQLDTNDYFKVNSSLVDVSTPIDTNVYEFIPQSPLKFQEGDIFGVHIPRDSQSKLILKEQRESGPINLLVSVDLESPPSFISNTILQTDSNDFPLVTAEISIITPSVTISTTNVTPTSSSTISNNDELSITLLVSNTNSFIISSDVTQSSTFKITEPIPTPTDQQPTTITGLVTTPVVSSTESTNSTNTVIISTSVGVLVILLVGVVILVVGSSLCLMRYRKKQLPLQEEVTTDTDILAQNNPSYIPTSSQGINLEDNPSYSSTIAAANPNVDGIYIDVNTCTSYNAVHHDEEDDYI